jgi:NAD(P)H-dependent FMN reductase
VSDTDRRVLLLIGSPRGLQESNSARFGRPVLDGLAKRGWASDAIHLHEAVRSEPGRQGLLEAVDRASVVVFASPLYVDSLPAPAIHALELIAAHRAESSELRMPRFVSLINCGFVEPSQNDTCQAILRLFAQRARLEHVGGLSIGAGGAITKRVRQAIELLVESLDLELLIPNEVGTMIRKPIMPGWLYVLVGNAMWRRLAAKNGAKDRLRDRPYAR